MQRRLLSVIRDPWVAALLMLALSVRLIGLPARTLWYDEAYSAMLSRYSLSDIWYLTGLDVHPPLYYFCLRLATVLFGDSLWVIRGLSVLAGTLAVLLAACWLRLFASQRAFHIGLLLLALQPIAVRYSQEARMYALLTLWLMAGSLTLALWLRRPGHWRYPVLYALWAAAAMYTHYFAIFALASHWAYAVMTAKGRSTLLRDCRWWLANLAAALLYLPWLPELWLQLHSPRDLDWIGPLSWTAVAAVPWQFFWVVDDPLYDWPGLGLLVPAFVGWVLWQLRGRRHADDGYQMILLVVLPLALACLVSLAIPLLVARYLSFAALPLALLIALAVDSLWQRYPRRAVLLLALLCTLQALAITDERLHSPQRTGTGVGELAAHIYRHWRPGDATVVHNGFEYLSAVYYLRRYPVPWVWVDPHDSSPVNRDGIGLVYRLAGRRWLWQYDQTPPGTCGIWLFSHVGEPPPVPSGEGWTPGFRHAVYETQLQYYARRSCTKSTAKGSATSEGLKTPPDGARRSEIFNHRQAFSSPLS